MKRKTPQKTDARPKPVKLNRHVRDAVRDTLGKPIAQPFAPFPPHALPEEFCRWTESWVGHEFYQVIRENMAIMAEAFAAGMESRKAEVERLRNELECHREDVSARKTTLAVREARRAERAKLSKPLKQYVRKILAEMFGTEES